MTRARRFWRWSRQAHVLLGAVVMLKLLWFDAQADVGLPPVLLWAATLGTSVLLVCWLPLVRPRPRLVLVLVIDLLVSTLVLVDLLHFRFFSSLVTLALLPQAGQTDDVAASILALFSWSDLWLYADVVALLVLVLVRRTGPLLASAGGFRSARSRELVVFAVIIGTTVLGFPVSALVRSGPFNVSWDMMAYQTTGLVGFHAYDAIRFAEDRWGDREASPEELARVEERLADQPSAPLLDGVPGIGAFADAPVLLVQVEGLESTVVGRSFEGRRITPHLDELIADSVSFPDTFHQVGAGHTADAEWLTACSLYPAEQGTAFLRYADNEHRCLPEILRERGYATAAHHANDRTFWNRSSIYPGIGYDRFYAADDIEGERLGSWGVGDREFLAQTVTRLAAQPTRSFELAITLTSHHPYQARLPRDSDQVSGSLDGTILGDYLDSVAYVDAALGAMVEQMRRDGTWDETIVVIYGDHDSGIPDLDLWTQFLGGEPTPYEQAVQRRSIPMVVHLPGDAAAGLEVQQPMGQVDVAPMLGHLLGLGPEEQRTFLGVDPFATRSLPVAFRNGGFATSDLFLSSPAGPCFDRASGAEVALATCADARAVVASELAVSDTIIEHDLLARARP